jgi:hypothetical protein
VNVPRVVDRASDRLLGLVTARAPARLVAITRIVIGVVILAHAVETWRVLRGLADPLLLRLPGWSFMPAPTPALVIALTVIWGLTAITFALGYRTRVSGSALVAALAIVLCLDEQTYSNHLYLMTIVVGLLTLADCGAALSLDARRAGARPDVPAWPVTLLKAQLSIVYGFAAVAKLNGVYLSGRALARVVPWQPIAAVVGMRATVYIVIAASIAAVVTELLLAVWFWSPRWRARAVVLGILLHTGIVALMPGKFPLALFAGVMFSLYPLFWGDRSRERVGLSIGAGQPDADGSRAREQRALTA